MTDTITLVPRFSAVAVRNRYGKFVRWHYGPIEVIGKAIHDPEEKGMRYDLPQYGQFVYLWKDNVMHLRRVK